MQSCIKVNNILAAGTKLRDILEKLTAEDGGVTQIDPDAARTEPEPEKSIFDVKIIRATNLVACDWTTSDPYVILSYEGDELERTRHIDRTLNPVWNHEFKLDLPHFLPSNKSFLTLIVMDKDFGPKDDICGTTTIFMRESLFDDFLAHDRELKLDPQGTLFVRVTKRGEVDDKRFWVRKAEELLRFTLEDMMRGYSQQVTCLYFFSTFYCGF